MKNSKRTRVVGAALAVLWPTAPALTSVPAAGVYADPMSPEVHLSGSLDSVDVPADHAIFVTDSGLRYTLDTGSSDVISLGGRSALQPGMRVRVTGTPLSDGTIRADRVEIVSESAPPTTDTPPSSSLPPQAADAPDTIHLRGTVENVDQRQGSFIVRINNHTRTVFMDDSTDIAPDTSLPLRPGERVTVGGIIRPDGTVVADTVQSGPVEPQGQDLTGQIVQPSSRYGSRDIKIRTEDGAVVTVHVPDDIPVTRNGLPISIHALSDDDTVRIQCFPDGSAVQATQIEVIHYNRKKVLNIS